MIKLQNVSKIYNTNNNLTLGLQNINLELHKNEFVAITGESGSGKSTLVKVISGMMKYEEGEMYLNNLETSHYTVSELEEYRKNNVGFITQEYTLIDSYSVYKNVELALLITGLNKKERKLRIEKVLKAVGLWKRRNNRGIKLSGGEKQRVAIARALVNDNPILVCDEPTGNLDSQNGKKIVELIKQVSKDRLVLYVTHNYDQVKEVATRKIKLHDGKLVEDEIINKHDEVIEFKSDVKQNKFTFFKIALYNILSTPFKSIFSILVFLVASFILTGLVSMNIDYDEDNYDYNEYNLNINEDRIILKKYDNSNFTNEELNALKDNKDIYGVFDYDLTFNDYVRGYLGEYYGYYNFSISYKNLSENDLVYGSLPKDANDIVLPLENLDKDINPESLINKTFDDYSNGLKYTICGIHDVGNYIIGNKNFYDLYYLNSKELYIKNNDYGYILGTVNIFNEENKDYDLIINSNITDINIIYDDENIEISKDNIKTDDSIDGFILNINKANEYIPINQISVFIDNPTKDNLSKLEEDYNILHYSLIKENNSLDSITDSLIFFTKFINYSILFILAFFFSYLILSYIVKSKIKDFNVLRTLGLNKNNFKNIILFENIIYSIIAFILVNIFYLIKSLNDTYHTSFSYQYIHSNNSDKLIIFVLLLIISYFLSRKIIKKYFKKSLNDAIKGDII